MERRDDLMIRMLVRLNKLKKNQHKKIECVKF